MFELKNIHYQQQKINLLGVEKLMINQHDMLGILGPNGAGKSTLLKIISGDYACDGEKILHGKQSDQWSARELARHLAFLPQFSELTFPFTSYEVVSLGLIPLTISNRQRFAVVQHYMQLTECHHLADRLYTTLSGGEKQRIHLARVLLQLSQAEKNPLLLLDEPTSAQDLKHQHFILQLISDLSKKGYGIVAVLHDINLASRYCNRLCLLKQGKIVYNGKVTDVLNTRTIHEIWGYTPEAHKVNAETIIYS